MAVYTDAIQKLYVAYFNRPADYEGLNHWEKVLTANNGNIDMVSGFFAASPEYKDQVAGKSNYQIVNQIYNNLFNRDADVEGLQFWSDRLTEGTFTVDQIVKVIADNASDTQDKDATTYKNKVAAAAAFTGSLDTAAEIIGYSGDKANTAAKTWLSTIGTDESLELAIAPGTLAATVNAVAQTGLSTSGQTYTLTKALDGLTGTSGNDTFVGSVSENSELNTLSALDSLNGGTGIDTLRILTDGTADDGISMPALNSIEIIEAQSSGDLFIDASSATGVTNLNVNRASGDVGAVAGANTDISVSLANPTGYVGVGGGKNINIALTNVSEENAVYVGGEAPAAKGDVVINVTGKSYAATDEGLDMGDIMVVGGKTVTVTQKAASSITAANADTDVSTVVQGDIEIYGNESTTTVTVKQDAYAEAEDAEYTTGGVTETASVKFSALAAGQTIIMGGLTFKATVAMTAAEAAGAFANLIKGTLPVAGDTQGSGAASKGIYTGAFTGWTSAAANGDTVVFTSTTARTDVGTLVNTGTGTVVVTPTDGKAHDATATDGVMGVYAGVVAIDDEANTIKTVTIDGYSDEDSGLEGGNVLATVSLANGGSFAMENAAATLNLSLNNVLKHEDEVAADIAIGAGAATLNLKATGDNLANLDSDATTVLNVNGSGTVTATVSSLANLKTIKVTETAGLNLGASELAKVESVDTTGTTGSVTVAIDGDIATYTGGAGADKVTLTAATSAVAKSVSLGAGDDTLDLTALDATKLGSIGATVTLSGGEGTDTIALSSAAAATLSTGVTFETKINGFEKLSVGRLFGNTTVNMDNLDDINFVISNGNGSADTPAVLPSVGLTGNTAGRSAITESTTVAFGALADTQSYTVGGRTVTASAALSAAQVAAAFASTEMTGTGWTAAGTVGTGWNVGAPSGSIITFTSTTAATDITTNLATSSSLGAPALSVQTTEGRSAVNESNVVDFVGLSAGQSFTVGGRTVTASGAADAAAVAAAFISGNSTGTLTVSGSLNGWTVDNNGAGSATDARFTSTTPATDVAAIEITGNGASGATTLTLDKMLNNATVQLNAAGNVTVNLTDASGTADVVNFIANAGSGTTIGTVTANKVETINFTANDTTPGTGVSSNTVTVAADAAKTINVSGAGDLSLTLASTTKAVTLIDGSAATGKLTVATSAQTDAVAATVKGGSANDVLKISGDKADVLEGGAGADTLIAGSGLGKLTGGAGNDLFKINVASKTVNSYTTITDFSAGDLVQVGTVATVEGAEVFTALTKFNATAITQGETAVFQDFANAAVNTLAVGTIGWFVFGGNTYLVADIGANSTDQGFKDGEDFIVKLTGTFDLSNASFNDQYGTIGLI